MNCDDLIYKIMKELVTKDSEFKEGDGFDDELGEEINNLEYSLHRLLKYKHSFECSDDFLIKKIKNLKESNDSIQEMLEEIKYHVEEISEYIDSINDVYSQEISNDIFYLEYLNERMEAQK